MKVSLLLLSTLLISVSSIYSQTTTAFRVNYNQALFDLPANAVESLTSDRYVFAGTNLTFLPIYGTITEVDNTGALVWSKRYYDGSLGFQINDIKKDATLNEYYLCGGSESNAAVFLRVDASGNLVVSKKFSISEADGAYLNRVQKTSDGGYIAVGYVTGYDPDGAGSEIDFAPITYTDANGDSQTDQIASPLIVKFDASGTHQWHRVFRYYTAATLNPATERIYNDASFNDIIETTDGYIAVGQYDVNHHRSATNSDGDDATPTDALILKTDLSGNITYHKQYDAVSSNTSQTSKSLSAINKTSTGTPIAAGSDNGKEWIIKFAATGGWTATYSRLWTYSSSFFGTPDPVDISQIYEVSGSTDLVTMSMYIKPLSFVFSDAMHRMSSNAQTNVWGKYYTFSLATLLPRGSQTSDGGYLMASMTTGTGDYDYHVIKTDPTGTTPSGCAQTTFTPTASAGSTTVADPFYNSWSGTVGSQSLTVTVAAITPTSSIQCSFTPCTTPATPTAAVASQPDCATSTGSITLTGLPTTGTWTVTGSPSGSATGNTSSTTISGLAAGSYTFTVTLSGCTSAASSAVTINAAPTVPTAPVIGTITQPTCSVGTGSVQLTGLPSTGTWTVTGTPSGTASGSGTATVLSGLNSGTYTFIVNDGTCSSTSSLNAVINAPPSTPTSPVVGSVTQPTCSVPTGSVDLSGLPSSGSWTVTASPGGSTISGTGTAVTFSGLSPNTYTFTVTNASGCTSVASATSATINAAPSTPSAPVIGTITQPSCGSSTGSVDLSGLPSSGSWTITTSPGGATLTGSGTSSTFSALSPNSYTFTVTDNIGCVSAASLNATINAAPSVPTAPVVGIVTDPTCSTPTGSVDLSGLPSTGTWTVTASPGGATTTGTGVTTTFSGLAAGTYSFTVVNSDGCTSSASSTNATITAAPSTPTTPVTGTVTQPSCSDPNGSIQLTGLPASGTWTATETPGGATYNGSGTTTVITITSAGTYTYFVTNDAGCNSTASSPGVTINAAPSVPTAPIVGAVTDPNCSTPTGSVDLSGLPSTGTWTVTASPGGATTTGTGTTTTFSGLAAGTYSFTVVNSDGCTSSASSTNATINSFGSTPGTPVTGTVTQPDCTNPNGSIQLTGLPSSGNWTVTESPGGATYSGSGTTTVITITSAGTYTYTVTNDAGCNSAASSPGVTINAAPSVPTAPIVGTVTDPTCTSVSSVALSGLPSTGTWTITASPGGSTITGTGTTANFTNLSSGTYTFTVTNAAGCTSSSSSASATINPAPSGPLVSVASQNDVSCNGDTDGTASLNVTGGTSPYTYSWTSGAGSSASVTGLAPGTYTATVTDNAGCTSTVSVIINEPAAITPNSSGSNVDCTTGSGGSITTTASGGTGAYSYSWSPGGQTTSSLSGLQPGNYSVTITDANGCTATQSTSVSTSGSLVVTATPSYSEINSGGSVAIQTTGGTTYSWTPATDLSCADCPDPIASPIVSTEYIVTTADANGCSGQDTVYIKVTIQCGEYFVPTAFSPNENGPSANDHLCLFGNPACISELDFAIYNRWGEVVYQTTDITKCWDGTYKDKPMDSGIFVYKLYVKLVDGTVIENSGNTTLVR